MFKKMIVGKVLDRMLGGGSGGAGIPAPKTAEEMKSDMDTLYAGTTPWERLGASSGGVVQASSQQDVAKMQFNLQKNQQAHDMSVARLNAENSAEMNELNARTSAYNTLVNRSTQLDSNLIKSVMQGFHDFTGTNRMPDSPFETKKPNEKPITNNSGVTNPSSPKQKRNQGRSRRGRNNRGSNLNPTAK
jgi:hypothetical protein